MLLKRLSLMPDIRHACPADRERNDSQLVGVDFGCRRDAPSLCRDGVFQPRLASLLVVTESLVAVRLVVVADSLVADSLVVSTESLVLDATNEEIAHDGHEARDEVA